MKNAFRQVQIVPGISSLIREIDVDISEIWESKHNFAQ